MRDRHVVIGTAGHVDHGKTALVRALTGVDTDRWAEEKRRGITIDLGFAMFTLPTGPASVVDVPGHEDFIRNMVAGATGIDVALLVIAADEGIMPQTLEHLAILEFLGVPVGVVAVTKSDLVEREWLELVQGDVRERLATSSIGWSDPVAVSAVTGGGLDLLREALASASARATGRSARDLFRLPVDRSFSVAGAGTVVTGTAWSGSVAVGDTVRVLPGEERTRVRSIEVHGEIRERAEPGRRTALALPNVPRHQVPRGAVVVSDEAWQASRVIDVVLTLLPAAKAISQRSRVRMHLGTAEVMARVTPELNTVEPGSTGGARLRLETPVVARWGDRAVIRSYSPMATVGGCVVVDPWPSRRPRRPRALAERGSTDPETRLWTFVREAGTAGVPIQALPVRVGVHPTLLPDLLGRLPSGGVVQVENTLLAESVLHEAGDAMLTMLRGYHHQNPLQAGMSRELIRGALYSPAIANAATAMLEARGEVVVEGETARLAGFRAGLSDSQGELGRCIEAELLASGSEGRTAAELAQCGEGGQGVVEYFVRQGTAVRVGGDRFLATTSYLALRESIVAEIRRLGGRATPAELRAKTGLTRKYLIPILESLDNAGFTVRDGDGRRLGPRVQA